MDIGFKSHNHNNIRIAAHSGLLPTFPLFVYEKYDRLDKYIKGKKDKWIFYEVYEWLLSSGPLLSEVAKRTKTTVNDESMNDTSAAILSYGISQNKKHNASLSIII